MKDTEDTADNNKDKIDFDFAKYNIHTPEFTLRGFNTLGRLVNIIDGDSLSIVLPVFGNFYKYSVRLNGIDTCEMRSKNSENKNLAIAARNALLELVTGHKVTDQTTRQLVQEILDKRVIVVFVECLDFDKYGRLLANVYFQMDNDRINLSDYLLKHKLAYEYTGNTKLTEGEQLEVLNDKR